MLMSQSNPKRADLSPSDRAETEITTSILSALNSTSRTQLARTFTNHPSSSILSILLTFSVSNPHPYKHEQDSIQAANELLGPSVSPLNAIQISCFIGDEELACDILDYVANVTRGMDARKVLFEFMGRVWGDGNTVLHLASFLGMDELVRRLLELGANVNRKNDRGYRAVDCTEDELTRARFQKITNIVRIPVRRSLSVDSASMHRKLVVSEPVDTDDKQNRRHSLPAEKEEILKQPLRKIVSPGLSLPTENKENQTKTDEKTPKKEGNEEKKPPKPERLVVLSKSTPISSISSANSGFTHESYSSSVPRSSGPNSPRGRIRNLINSGRQLPAATNDRRGRSKDTKVIHGGLVDRQRRHFNEAPELRTYDASHKKTTKRSDTASNGSILSSVGRLMQRFNEPPGAGVMLSAPAAKSRGGFVKSVSGALSRSTGKKSAAIPPKTSHVSTIVSAKAIKSTESKSPKAAKVRFDYGPLILDLAKNGEYQEIKVLIDRVPQTKVIDLINARLPQREMTPLHLAASYNHLSVCKLLLELNARIDEVDSEGWSVLHCACAEGNVELVDYFCKTMDSFTKKAVSSWVNDDGETVWDVSSDERVRNALRKNGLRFEED